ncbi:MAG: folate-binding protein [Alphaproteobacteria bacterium]|nr:folate-binding protein [Alphaproteobacteria bacterium]
MPSFVQLTERGLISLSGSDRVSFLQGLVSNDVTQAESGRPVWSALLSPQGKYRHDFFILKDQDRLLLDCEGGDRMMDLGKTLRRYVLRADAKLDIEGAWSVFAAWNIDPSAIGLSDDQPTVAFADGLAYLDPRLPEMGIRLLAPQQAGRAALTALGANEVAKTDWDAHRIPLGVPDGARDMQPDKALLLENGFAELHGVDWKKGCYMGQELTARTKYRGLVKKRLMPVRIEGDAPEEGSQITSEGKDAGTLYSIAGPVGLALLRVDPVKRKAPLEASGARLEPAMPDWLTLAE